MKPMTVHYALHPAEEGATGQMAEFMEVTGEIATPVAVSHMCDSRHCCFAFLLSLIVIAPARSIASPLP